MTGIMDNGNTKRRKYFEETIANKGVIAENNPYKNDKAFLYGLLSYFESKQEYDKCVELLDRIFALG